MARSFRPNDHVVIVSDQDFRNVGKQLRLVEQFHLFLGPLWKSEALEPMYCYTSGRMHPAGTVGLIDERMIRHLADPDDSESVYTQVPQPATQEN